MGWLSTPCSDKQHFICERYHDVPEYKWSKLDGTLYHISQSSKTSYSFARKFCQEQGGDLAQPKTEEINNHLIRLANGNSFWFGLNINTGQREFEWISGTRIINEFPNWSNYSNNGRFNNERCVHQQVKNGWRKLPCTSYLRFACEKLSRPRPVRPIRLIAATTTPYEGGGRNSSYLCLLGSEVEDILKLSTRRLVRLTEDINPDSFRAPGNTRNVSSHSHVGLRQTLPPSNDQGFGFFECSSVTASRKTTVPLGIASSTRKLQPFNGRLTRTVHVGDNVTLSVMNVYTRIEGDSWIEWKKFIDEGWNYSVIERSSSHLSHTIQSAVTSDAGVYVTYRNGMLQQRQFSFIRLIVRECPPGRWNPPSCDRLCDNCYNGGICHEFSGTCICPPGHAGKNCLQACGRHKFGWDCELGCGRGQLLDKCAGSQICLPDPYGCNCLAGYTGIYCNETCLRGRFGSDCLQKCHCLNGADCDHVTGECPSDSGCSKDWSGPACQVPSVCPTGYFGSNCTKKCNCRNETACHKNTGYCDEVEGRCDVGYVKDSVHLPSSCTTFSGCYRSCSKTCHCSGGIEDCNFLTGNCNSSTCHPRWTGDQCQTDCFKVRSEKTNPGVANFSCSYTKSSRTKYVKAAVGTLNEDHLINHTTSISPRQSITSYFYEYIGREKPIYCFVGDPENSSGFAFIRLPPGDFYALPNYTGKPELIEAGYYHAVVRWRQWNPENDTGDGPVVGYKIYVRLGNNDEVQPPERVLSKRSTDNATEIVTYNVTELEAGSTYAIQIAAIRDGIKGEGKSGPILTVTTGSLPVTSTVSSTTKTIAPGGQTSSSMATVAGGVVGIIIVILIIIIVIILFKQRRKVNPSKTVHEEQETSIDFEDTALDGGCSGQVTISTQIKPTPRSIGTKPAIAAKPCRRELADATHRAQEPSDDQSGTKPLKRQPIPTSQFPAFVSTNRYTSLFSDEFHDLPEADIYPQTVAQEEINHRKNRYKNILPYDSARVKLNVINEGSNSDYFNASYIPSFENDKAYIASQGPNNASMDDFWRMVWQEKVTTIAMVTKLKEGDKIKCAQYWPNKPGDSKMFGNVKVEFVSQNTCTGGVKREITLKMGKDKRTVTQFHFRVWPDKGVPKHTSLLLKFIKEVKTNHGQNPHPLVIHCSAGVGRTGVVISIDSIAAHAKMTRMVDVFSFVTKIRQNRPYMVQTQEQYAFIYGAVLEDLLWRDTLVPIIHFSDHLKDLRSVDERGKSMMAKEFETLMTLCPDPPASQLRSGRTQENHHKNRYGNNLKFHQAVVQRNRVILDSRIMTTSNASCGVHCTFITTQMPMPSTVSLISAERGRPKTTWSHTEPRGGDEVSEHDLGGRWGTGTSFQKKAQLRTARREIRIFRCCPPCEEAIHRIYQQRSSATTGKEDLKRLRD
nr:LOW QUALITY PROTEIN: uncharacterized protein LOC129271718 [Lytechinus pictus]